MAPAPSSEVDLYDARGNRYAIISPEVQGSSCAPNIAAQSADRWGPKVLRAVRERLSHRCLDGVLIGPFGPGPPFDVLIMNTDGSLAERSGNGLTIFGRALVDRGAVAASAWFEIRVHHAREAPDPLVTRVRVHEQDRVLVELGTPTFGPEAIGAASGGVQAKENGGWTIDELAKIDAGWTNSVPVRLGNPHCVTFLEGREELPTRAQLEEDADALQEIAVASSGQPRPIFKQGTNLQWATLSGPQTLDVRIFERGEGWTQSSGTSASAVAAAAHRLAKVNAGAVTVRMPGGEAVVIIESTASGRLTNIIYEGVAKRL